MHRIEQFFSTWRFAVASTSLILSVVGFMTAVLVVPVPTGPAAAFAESFKIWCFGYDPATGTFEWVYVWMFLIQPLLMIGIIMMIWGGTMRDARSAGARRVAPYMLVPCALVLVGAAMLVRADAQATTDLAAYDFPGERIRTSYHAPAFTLTDHRDRSVKLSDLTGRPVLVTAVYTSCGMSCPRILNEVRRTIAHLDEADKRQLSIVVLTLDPTTDTPEVLAALARAHSLVDDQIHFLTGSVEAIDETLRAYSFGRSKNLETGVIDHANLFVLLDAEGRVAYRFTLGERQRDWMAEAVEQLIAESATS